MNTEKTIQEWLGTLNEPERSQALENYDPDFGIGLDGTLGSALIDAFDWSGSTQGEIYWHKIRESIRGGEYKFDGEKTTKTDTPETDAEPHNVGNLAMLCRKLERERDEARRESQWQPIETAPKEGSILLGKQGEQNVATRGWAECEDGSFNWQSRIRGAGQATHWMPLPKPPTN